MVPPFRPLSFPVFSNDEGGKIAEAHGHIILPWTTQCKNKEYSAHCKTHERRALFKGHSREILDYAF